MTVLPLHAGEQANAMPRMPCMYLHYVRQIQYYPKLKVCSSRNCVSVFGQEWELCQGSAFGAKRNEYLTILWELKFHVQFISVRLDVEPKCRHSIVRRQEYDHNKIFIVKARGRDLRLQDTWARSWKPGAEA